MNNKPQIFKILLVLMIALGFLVRLYRFDGPIADWHSWRQADTSAVSRTFVQKGFDVLHPKYEDLSNVPSGLENPNGYRFVEFPIYNVLQGGLFTIFKTFTIEEWGRLVSIFGSLLSGVFIFLLIKKRFGLFSAFLSTFFYLFLPFNIYYSRAILPDTLMVTAVLGGIYFFDKWLWKSKLSIFNRNFFLTLFFITCSFLLKPYALFFMLPVVFLAYEKLGLKFLRKWQFYLLLVISLLPLIFWRIWMQQYPSGIPASDWLFNSNGIRFKGAFFYWLFADRIGRLILGFWGIPLLLLGLLVKQTKNNLLFLLSFTVSSLLYLTVIATGNVQHDYYQILIIPTVAILTGVGASYLITKVEIFNKYVAYTALVVCIGFSIFFSLYFVRDYFNINNPSIVVAGNAVDKLTPKDAKVIANYNGDTSFLYQTNRNGWASFEKSIPELIEMGANYMVFVNPTEGEIDFGKTYKLIAKTKQYVIFNLNQKP